jgi:hypothetical protein
VEGDRKLVTFLQISPRYEGKQSSEWCIKEQNVPVNRIAKVRVFVQCIKCISLV